MLCIWVEIYRERASGGGSATQNTSRCEYIENHIGGNVGQKDCQKTYSCVVPASTYGLETLALSEQHQHKLQACGINWIRRIVGVIRVERRRMEDLREDVVTKACIVGKIVKIRMKWVGHMVRMKYDKLQKRS